MSIALAVLCAALAGKSPFAREEVPREERWGTVWLSDGTKFEGPLHLTMARDLTVYDDEEKEWKQFKLSELQRVSFGVEKTEEVPVWRWKEGGSDEKVYTGESYPNLTLWCEAVTSSEEKARGHVLGTVIHGEGEKEKKKFILRKYVRGKTGETPEQVVYPREIVFHEKGEHPPGPAWLKR